MVKIIRIISRLNVGGPAQHAILLSQYFQNSDWQTTLISGVEGELENNMLSLAKNKNVVVKRIQTMRRKIEIFSDFLSFIQLIRIFKKFKPQILHTHTAKAGALGRLAGIFAGIPIKIHTFHGHALNGYFPTYISKIFVFIERLLGKQTDCIITLTQKLKEDLSSMGIHGRFENRVIPLGLELERFTSLSPGQMDFRKELGIPQGHLLIGIVGRLVPIKRHSDLLEAMKVLYERKMPVHLAIVGGGELENSLKVQAQQLNLESRVHFLWLS